MAHKTKPKGFEVFGLSFLDVFANTIGGLSFILLIAMIMMGGLIIPHDAPLILTETLPDAFHGSEYRLWLSGREGQGRFTWQIDEDSLPQGLRLSPLGLLSGTPVMQDPTREQEIYPMQVSASYGGRIDHREFDLRLKRFEFGEIRIITPPVLPAAVVGRPYPLAFSAQGGQSPYTWEIEEGGIQGLELGSEGVFSGEAAAEGLHSFTITARDNLNQSVHRQFRLEVLDCTQPPPPPPLVIKTRQLPTALAGMPYDLSLAAEGGRSPYAWSGTISVPGLQIDPEGKIQGVPEETGDYFVDLVTTDETQQRAEVERIPLKVLPQPRTDILPVEILTQDLLPGISGETYPVVLAADKGEPPYAWSLLDRRDLPANITLTQQGMFTGSLPSPAEYSFVVQVEDIRGRKAEREFTLPVLPANLPLTIPMKESLPKAVKNIGYSLTCHAEGGYPPYAWEMVTPKDFPENLELVDSTIQGIPQQAWRGRIRLRVNDQIGQSTEREFYLEILDSGEGVIAPKLELLTQDVPNFMAGSPVEFFFAWAGGGFPLRWDIQGDLPKGLTFRDGVIRGSPAPGFHDVTITVTDASGQTAEGKYKIESLDLVRSFWKRVAIIAIGLVLLLLLLAIWFYLKWKPRPSKDLEIITKSIPNARASSDYRVYLALQGGVPPYKWEIIKGELPPGLKLTDDGIIEGKAYEGIPVVKIQDHPVTIQVKDATGAKAQQEL